MSRKFSKITNNCLFFYCKRFPKLTANDLAFMCTKTLYTFYAPFGGNHDLFGFFLKRTENLPSALDKFDLDMFYIGSKMEAPIHAPLLALLNCPMQPFSPCRWSDLYMCLVMELFRDLFFSSCWHTHGACSTRSMKKESFLLLARTTFHRGMVYQL